MPAATARHQAANAIDTVSLLAIMYLCYKWHVQICSPALKSVWLVLVVAKVQPVLLMLAHRQLHSIVRGASYAHSTGQHTASSRIAQAAGQAAEILPFCSTQM